MDGHLLARFLARFHPRLFLQTLALIDREAKIGQSNTEGVDYRAAAVLLTAAVCLLLLHYLKFETAFIGFLDMLSIGFGHPPHTLLRALQKSPYF